MARRNRVADLAGLAALGALAYKFGSGRQAPAPVEDRSRYVDRAGDAVTSSFASGDPGYSDADMAEYRRQVAAMQPAAQAAAEAPMDTSDFLSRRLRINPETGEAYSMDNIAPMDRPRVARPATPRADAIAAAYRDPSRRLDVLQRGQPPARQAAPAASRPPTREELMAQIPMGGTRTVEGGERVSGNEFTRNVGNILNAPVPGFVPVSGAVRAAKAAEVPLEGREMVSNPMAWMAGPKGMKQMQAQENAERAAAAAAKAKKKPKSKALSEEDVTGGAIGYKKGGKVKKMSSGGMSSASKRGDGIASRGKTKCKMY